MKKQKRERLKSAALVLLMALSLVQMGILWNLTQGFPFSFYWSQFLPITVMNMWTLKA